MNFYHPAESEFRRHLRSTSSHELSVPCTRLSTYSDRAFPVAAVRIWNSLLQHLSTPVPSTDKVCSALRYGNIDILGRQHEYTGGFPHDVSTKILVGSCLQCRGARYRAQRPHPRRHFPSSALAWRHTSLNCVIHKLLSCLRSDIVILDTLIVLLTYLLTYPTCLTRADARFMYLTRLI